MVVHSVRIMYVAIPSLSEAQHKSADRQTIRSGRGWILAVAVFNVVIGAGVMAVALTTAENEGSEIFVLGVAILIIGLIFTGCWLWARRSPFPAALTALLIYIALVGSSIAVDPTEAVRGIVFKALFLVGLSSAVHSAYRLKKSEYNVPDA